MLPPLIDDRPGHKVIDQWTHDVSDWFPAKTFDTATACEAERERRADEGTRWLADKASRGEVELEGCEDCPPLKDRKLTPAQEKAFEEEFNANARKIAGRCVPAETIYPPKTCPPS